MNGKDVRYGQRVATADGTNWEVLDRSKPGHWWLHRWNGHKWEVCERHAREITYICDGSRIRVNTIPGVNK